MQEVLAFHCRTSLNIKRYDLLRTRAPEWLNDQIINATLAGLLMVGHTPCLDDHGLP